VPISQHQHHTCRIDLQVQRNEGMAVQHLKLKNVNEIHYRMNVFNIYGVTSHGEHNRFHYRWNSTLGGVQKL
jgi:hypothetical protein